MATVTTNYGFDIPQSSDLVKDGATAIATLGQDIDTAMNTALGTKKAGMVLLNTTSFSAVSSFSLATNTFTSAYDNYRILIDLTGTGNNVIRYRMRAAGTDDSTSNYDIQYVQGADTTSTIARFVNQNIGDIGYAGNSARNMLIIELFSPALAQTTSLRSINNPGDASNIFFRDYTSRHKVSSAFDSISIVAASGTITGTYSVYGYNK